MRLENKVLMAVYLGQPGSWQDAGGTALRPEGTPSFLAHLCFTYWMILSKVAGLCFVSLAESIRTFSAIFLFARDWRGAHCGIVVKGLDSKVIAG